MTETSSSEAARVCLLIIGNEILSGRTRDANLAMVASGVAEIGVRLAEVRVIPDIEPVIVETLNQVRHRFDYVVTTGGIGPTHDDITAACVARAFGVANTLHPEAHALLVRYFAERGIPVNEARLRMAHTPEGATLIANAISVAPGFRIGNVFVLAGVPGIAAAMFEEVKRQMRGGPPILARTVATDLPEGAFAEALGAIQTDHGSIDIGSYPRWSASGYDVSIVLRGTDAASLAVATGEVVRMIEALGGTATERPTA